MNQLAIEIRDRQLREMAAPAPTESVADLQARHLQHNLRLTESWARELSRLVFGEARS